MLCTIRDLFFFGFNRTTAFIYNASALNRAYITRQSQGKKRTSFLLMNPFLLKRVLFIYEGFFDFSTPIEAFNIFFPSICCSNTK